MSRTYFDAVLDDDFAPIFNGTPDETREFLEKHGDDENVKSARVCPGKTLQTMTVPEYLALSVS